MNDILGILIGIVIILLTVNVALVTLIRRMDRNVAVYVVEDDKTSEKT